MFEKLGVLPRFSAGEMRIGNGLFPEDRSRDSIIGRWQNSQAPTPYLMEDRIRIYFSAREQYSKHSYPFYIDVSRDNPLEELGRSQIPALELGNPGEGDDSGVMVSHVYSLKADNKLRMLYTGWNKGTTEARYRTCCMSAIFEDGIWKKQGILMDRSSIAPCGTSMPFINIIEEDDYGPTEYEYHYMAYTKWEKSEPFYNIYRQRVSVFSGDVMYDKDPLISVSKEQSVARSWVWKNLLFYSTRGSMDYRSSNAESYKIEYSIRNSNGLYDPQGKLTILGETNPMTAYPSLLESEGVVYLFYNAGEPNDFQSPISVARLVK